MTTIVTPAHLGGHMNLSWIDEPVLDYLIDRYGIVSMLDVGCGLGGMIDLAINKGLYARGIDGDPQLIANGKILIHDYRWGPIRIKPFDLIWCVEFVEHVEAIYQENYLATFADGRVLFLTAAYPGQGGHHHVNEQPVDYWIDLLIAHGWTLDQEATDWTRKNGATPFSQRTGMVFTR